MKQFLNLGKALNKAEQNQINGGARIMCQEDWDCHYEEFCNYNQFCEMTKAQH